MMITEEDFPRGGRKPATKHKPAELQKDIFSTTYKKKPRENANKQIVLPKTDVGNTDLYATKAESMTYSRVQDNMSFLGRVRQVSDLSFDVSLPGKIFGTVHIQNISETYNKSLKEFLESAKAEPTASLSDFFKAGQYLPVKVLDKKVNDQNKTKLHLTVKPSDINSDISFVSIEKRMLLWGTVTAVEDHGYIIDLGVTHTRAFLPSVNIDEDVKYLLGQNIWCVVKKVEITPTASTVQLSAKSNDIEKFSMLDELNVNNLIPGAKIGVTVDKVLKTGLQIKASNGAIVGYITDSQLKSPFDKLSNYNAGDTLQARLLYIMPTTKFCYLTLYELKNDEYESGKLNYKFGDLCKAKILSKSIGIYVSLNDNQAKGYVSYKRLKNNQQKGKANKDLLEVLEKQYPNNSNHQARIIEYIPMERIYVCSFEEDFVKENVCVVDDLSYGETYTSTISEVCDNGVSVKIGRVFGFVTADHLSDVKLSFEAIKKKFKVGKPLKVRVWMLRSNNKHLLLTAKPSLLDHEECLWRAENAKSNQKVIGIVSMANDKGFLIGFYGGASGWLPVSNCGESYNRDSFSLGQTLTATIESVLDGKKIILTLKDPKPSKRNRIRLGQKVEVCIKKIVPDSGLEVMVIPNGILGFIPAAHLSNNTSLCNLLLNTYSVNDKIKDVMCVGITPKIILSIRESKNWIAKKIPKFNDLKEGMLIQCSFHSINREGMFLTSLIESFGGIIRVNPSDILDGKIDNWKNYTLMEGQPMLAKIIEINYDKKTIRADTKLSTVFNFDLKIAVNKMDEYMQDLKIIQNNLRNKNLPIADYYPGQHVKVIVKGTMPNSGGYRLDLNGINAFSRDFPSHKKMVPEMELDALILWIHYATPVIEVSLNPSTITKVNNKQTGELWLPLESTARVEVLLSQKSNDVIVTVLYKAGNKQLVFMPTMCCDNDWPSKVCLAFAEKNDKIKVVLKKTSNGKAIALPKKMIKVFSQRAKTFSKSKHKIEPVDDSNSEENETEETSSCTESPPSKKRKKAKNTYADDSPVISKKRKQNNTENDDSENVDTNSSQESSENSEHLQQVRSPSPSSTSVSEQVDESDKDEEIITDNSNDTDVSIQGIVDGDIEVKIEKETVETELTPKNKQRVVFNRDVRCKFFKPVKDEDEEEGNSDDYSQTLSLTGGEGFYSNVAVKKEEQEYVSSDSEDEIVEDDKSKKKKLSAAERKELARIEEERIRKRENELMNLPNDPENPDQFERLIMSSPNNSEMWIKYISFYIVLTEIDKARAVIKRALDAILFKQEQERFNIWIAWLNLENSYGTKDSFDTVLKEAVRCNDSLKINLQVLDILADSRKIAEYEEKARSLLKNKEFKCQAKLWIAIGKGFFTLGLVEKARAIIQQCKNSLNKQDYFNLLVQFALMEFTQENTEYGESLFQNITISCPQRVDVWCTYTDQLIKKRKFDLARNVLERAVGQKLSAKKMKTLFKKFIEFEKEHGDTDSLNKVKHIAVNYVESI